MRTRQGRCRNGKTLFEARSSAIGELVQSSPLLGPRCAPFHDREVSRRALALDADLVPGPFGHPGGAPQGVRDVLGDGDLPDPRGRGSRMAVAADVKPRVLPTNDHPAVAAVGAFEDDRCGSFRAAHHHPSRAGAVTWTPAARQCADPCRAGFCRRGCPDQVTQLGCQPTRRTGSVVGKVQEVTQIGRQHSNKTQTHGHTGLVSDHCAGTGSVGGRLRSAAAGGR